MTDIGFSRDQMLAPEAPPASQVGVVGWLRANLFSSWLNAILTILSALAVWWLFDARLSLVPPRGLERRAR